MHEIDSNFRRWKEIIYFHLWHFNMCSVYLVSTVCPAARPEIKGAQEKGLGRSWPDHWESGASGICTAPRSCRSAQPSLWIGVYLEVVRGIRDNNLGHFANKENPTLFVKHKIDLRSSWKLNSRCPEWLVMQIFTEGKRHPTHIMCFIACLWLHGQKRPPWLHILSVEPWKIRLS